MIQGCYREIKYTDTKTNEEYLYTLARRSDDLNLYYFNKYRFTNGVDKVSIAEICVYLTDHNDDLEKICKNPKMYFDYMIHSRTSALYDINVLAYISESKVTKLVLLTPYLNINDEMLATSKLDYSENILYINSIYEPGATENARIYGKCDGCYKYNLFVWIEYGKTFADIKDDIISFINEKLDNDNDSE